MKRLLRSCVVFIFALVLVLNVYLPGVASAQASLPQSFVTADGLYTFDYPASPWAAAESEAGLVDVANNVNALGLSPTEIQRGMVGLRFFLPEAVYRFGFNPTDTLDTVREVYDYSSPRTISTGSRDAVVVDVGDDATNFILAFSELEGGGLFIAAMFALVADGGLAPYQDVLLGVADSLRYYNNATPVRDPGDFEALARLSEVDTANLPTLDMRYQPEGTALALMLPAGSNPTYMGDIRIMSPNMGTGAVTPGEFVLFVLAPQILGPNSAFEAAETGRGAALQLILWLRFQRYDLNVRNYSRLESTTINGRDYALFTLRTDLGDAAVLAYEVAEGVPILLYGFAAQDDLQNMLPTFLAVAESTQYSGD